MAPAPGEDFTSNRIITKCAVKTLTWMHVLLPQEKLLPHPADKRATCAIMWVLYCHAVTLKDPTAGESPGLKSPQSSEGEVFANQTSPTLNHFMDTKSILTFFYPHRILPTSFLQRQSSWINLTNTKYPQSLGPWICHLFLDSCTMIAPFLLV